MPESDARSVGSVTGFLGRCCCLCIGRYSDVPAGLDCTAGQRGVMFGGILVVGNAAVEAVGVWTGFLHYQLTLCKVCVLSLVPEL